MQRLADRVARTSLVSGTWECTPAVAYPRHTTKLPNWPSVFYELRGRQEGHQLDDWLRAEQELVRHYA